MPGAGTDDPGPPSGGVPDDPSDAGAIAGAPGDGGTPVDGSPAETDSNCGCDPRPIPSITMKRKNIHLTGDDKYGHWWFEIDGSESYGWWPKYRVGLKETLFGTEGELNGQTTFGGTATTDPHQGDAAEEQFHPVVSKSDGRSDDEIKDCLRAFARGYSGEWRWTFGAGQNCHTFQEAAMKHCRLCEP